MYIYHYIGLSFILSVITRCFERVLNIPNEKSVTLYYHTKYGTQAFSILIIYPLIYAVIIGIIPYVCFRNIITKEYEMVYVAAVGFWACLLCTSWDLESFYKIYSFVCAYIFGFICGFAYILDDLQYGTVDIFAFVVMNNLFCMVCWLCRDNKDNTKEDSVLINDVKIEK